MYIVRIFIFIHGAPKNRSDGRKSLKFGNLLHSVITRKTTLQSDFTNMIDETIIKNSPRLWHLI